MRVMRGCQTAHRVDARTNGGSDGQGEEKPKEEYDVYIDLLLYCGPLDRRSPMICQG